MIVLTPAERKAVLLLTSLLLLGAVSDGLRDTGLQRSPQVRPGLDSAGVRVAGTPTPVDPGTQAPQQAADASNRVDLNRATAQDLDALPGVGPVLAARIIDHRARYGPFRRADDLRAVRGIGPKLFARLRDRVRIASPP